jgi:KAP family P-loop domain
MTDAWADSPISRADDDLLDRGRFAKTVIDNIDATPVNADSMVFGLLSPWGGGKSSLINMIVEGLPGSWSTQVFAPWAAADATALQIAFLAALDAAVGRSPAGANARAAVKKYVRWAIPLLNLVPAVGSTASQIASEIAADLLEATPWDQSFDEVSRGLAELEHRVLLICDDVDRLDAAELMQFLKVVRLLGRFPNVHYLIAYDAETVEEMLASQGVPSRVSSFMEKIVQHPFEVPAIGVQKRFELALDSLAEVAANLDLRFDEDQSRRVGDLASRLGRGLNTPRGHFRFRNDLSTFATLAQVGVETDFLDFAALSFLRLNYHEIFTAIPRWRSDLREGATFPGAKADDSSKRTSEEWLQLLRDTSTRVIDPWIPFEFLAFLFPQLDRRASSANHSHALADEDYFERYFNLAIADDDVSDRLTIEALDSIAQLMPTRAGVEEYLSQKIDSSMSAVSRLAIQKASRHRRGLSESGNSGAVIGYLDARLNVQRSDSEGYGSPTPDLRSWLAVEVRDAYDRGSITLEQLIARYDEPKLIQLLLDVHQTVRSQSVQGDVKLLSDFSTYYLRALKETDLKSTLGLDRLRVLLSLVSSTKGYDVLQGIFDERVSSDPALFADTVAALVQAVPWYGREVRIELQLDGRLWATVFTAPLLRRMVPELPSSRPYNELDSSDTSDANRREFAFAVSRELLKQLPEEAA